MNKKFGNCSGKKGWVGIRFIPQDEQEEDIINEI
jgi:hypothetical protein